VNLAGYFVEARDLAAVVDAVRAAYVKSGAVETTTGGLAVRVGKPDQGWSLVIDSTHHTVDMGVAEAVAGTLGKRVAVFGSRGSGSRGRGSIKVFGEWRVKPPTSLTPGKVLERVAGFAHELPQPWEIETRAGTVLTFDVANMKRTLGPFRDNGDDVILEVHRQQQSDAEWYVNSNALNAFWDDAKVSLAGLVGRWSWQSACARITDHLASRTIPFGPQAARLALDIATRAFEGVTASTYETTWEAGVHYPGHGARVYAALLASAVVAKDAEALTWLLASLDDAEARRFVAAELRERHGGVLTKAPATLRDRLQSELPAEVTKPAKVTPAKDTPSKTKPANAKPATKPATKTAARAQSARSKPATSKPTKSKPAKAAKSEPAKPAKSTKSKPTKRRR
jgi:hypothetical protein